MQSVFWVFKEVVNVKNNLTGNCKKIEISSHYFHGAKAPVIDIRLEMKVTKKSNKN